jgi:DNA-binding transcriptional LysR family regulator
MSLTITQIEALSLVAEFGSVSEAARQSGYTRTKLSMALKALESELDTQLLERTGNYIELSEAGKAIQRDCQSILSATQRIRQTCKQVKGEFKAEIWIARDDSLPDDFWQDLAHQLNNKFPATSFNIILASTGDLANLVETEQVDFAFGVDYERADDPRLISSPLGKIRMMSVCSAENHLGRMRRVTDDDLREEMQALMVYLNEKDNPDLEPFSRHYIGFSSFDYILSTIKTENAWGVMPEPLIRELLRERSLVVIKHTYGLIQENYCMFASAGISEHPGMNWLSDKLSDYLFDF